MKVEMFPSILWPMASVMGMYCNIKMLEQSWETECLFQCSPSSVEFYTILKYKPVARNHDLAINNSIILLIWWHVLGRRLLLFLPLKQICSLGLKEFRNHTCAEAVKKVCRELSKDPTLGCRNSRLPPAAQILTSLIIHILPALQRLNCHQLVWKIRLFLRALLLYPVSV